MNSSNRDYSHVRISRSVVNILGQPEAEAMLQIERSLDRLSQSQDTSARGLLLNLCRQLINTSGEAQSLSREELFNRLQPKYTAVQISGVLDQLQSNGMILASDGMVKLSSGILSKLIHAKIQAETAGQQKIEAFIANRYDYFLEKGQLLSEQDINYITPFLSDMVLDKGEQDFVEGSRKAIKKQKRRGAMVLVTVITTLSLLSLVAVFFAIESNKQTRIALKNSLIATEQTKKAIEDRRLAMVKEQEAQAAAIQAREAERAATQAKLELEQANVQIRGLLEKVTDESTAAKIAQKLAEEQRKVATERALEIEKLNKDLKLYAEDKERDAQVARDAEAEATEARKTSDELRNILLSRIVAQRSLALKEEDKDLKAYTAMLAYHINDFAESGDVLHPDIFRAVYYAARNQQATSVTPSVDLASGALGSLECQSPSACLTGASDGTIVQFTLDPNTGAILNQKQLFYVPHAAVRFVFPQTNSPGTSGTAFVLGALDHIIEISLPQEGGTATSTEIRKFLLPGRQFVKDAARTGENELMIQTADGALYQFECENGNLTLLLKEADDAVAWTALSHLGLICYATAKNELILTDRKRSTQVVYASAKKRVAQMQLKQYGSTIYLALAYADGELEVFISNQDAFLSAYQSQRQGKSYYQIQSLRANVHTGYIPVIEFADSRPLLAVCSYDGTMSVWDLMQWEVRRGDYQPLILDDHDDWVTACTFLPGDQSLLAGSKLGTVKYWSLDPTVYASGLCSEIGRSPNDEEWREYIGDELRSFKESVCRGK